MTSPFIYSTVPDEVLEDKTLDPNRMLIFEYLQNSNGPRTAIEIAKETGYKTTGTQVEVRKAITQLLEWDKKPIISVGRGFMLAEHPNQMRHYAERLLERCQGIERRAKVCREIANRMEE